jgi:hypothetical protein
MSNENEVQLNVAEYINKHSLTKVVEDAVNECFKAQAQDVGTFFVNVKNTLT